MKKEDIIIDANILMGKSNKSILKSHKYLDKFRSNKLKANFINQSVFNNYSSFFVSYDQELLKILKNQKNIELYPLIPDTSKYIRDMNNYGLIVMGLKRLLQLGVSIFSITITGVKNIFGILKKDFGSIVVLLTDIEAVKFKKFKPKVVFLHPQMTDLFLANNCSNPLRKYSNFIRKKYNTEPGLFTNNIFQLLKKLDEWNLDINHICTPINRRGYMMKPNQKKAEESIKRSKRRILGYDVTCGGTIEFEESINYIEKLGVEKVIIEKENFQ